MSNSQHNGKIVAFYTHVEAASDGGKRVVFTYYGTQIMRSPKKASFLAVIAILCAALAPFACSAAAEPAVRSDATSQGSTPANSAAKPLTIDLTGSQPPIMKGHLGLGTTHRPDGETIGADSLCCYRNGRPWIPVSGEFHFSRYPCEEWRDELLKMKAGGLDVVATYAFWNHHEEKQGEFDWSGQRCLRDFMVLCQEIGFKVIVRMGPWSHGEVRNGGFPDWVQRSGFRLRSQDPAYLKLVEPYWTQLAAQMRGLLWKDGGPIIGIQLDNECQDLAYLLTLKTMAQRLGVDVPFYTMTGWQAVLPREGLIPLQGGYADGFWTHDSQEFLDAFMFRSIQMVAKANLGANLEASKPDDSGSISRFPYLCCELGGGMVSGYDRRIHVTPDDVAAVALVTLGNGNNMPGYYIFQGAVNPDGKYSTLNENKTCGVNDLPIKDYDFGAPLGACGQVREQYHLLRQQHLFLRQFGEGLAVMQPFLPVNRPATLDDVDTLRWGVRSDGKRGVLFFNNHRRFGSMPAKGGAQFSLKMKQETLLAPSEPVTIPSDAYGMWPINLDCDGITVKYATAQPICRIEAEGQSWFFFAAIEGLQPDFSLSDATGTTRVQNIIPATSVAFTRRASNGWEVNFVVLTAEQGRQLWKLPMAGRDRVVLTPNAILPDSDSRIRIESVGTQSPMLAVFPPIASVAFDGRQVVAAQDGVFQRLSVPAVARPTAVLTSTALKPAEVSDNKSLNAMDEESWKSAAVWRLEMPTDACDRKLLVRIHYVGDVARVYAGGRLIADNFYNGEPFDLACWRIPNSECDDVELHIMPLRRDCTDALPEDVRPNLPKTEVPVQLIKIEGLDITQTAVSFGDGAGFN